MTKWHTEWQGNFPITEIYYSKNCKEQLKNRFADAILEEYNLVIEFQHSKIRDDEVNNRKNDYKLHNMELLVISFHSLLLQFFQLCKNVNHILLSLM